MDDFPREATLSNDDTMVCPKSPSLYAKLFTSESLPHSRQGISAYKRKTRTNGKCMTLIQTFYVPQFQTWMSRLLQVFVVVKVKPRDDNCFISLAKPITPPSSVQRISNN